jgi:hypothetical protein
LKNDIAIKDYQKEGGEGDLGGVGLSLSFDIDVTTSDSFCEALARVAGPPEGGDVKSL